MESYYGEVVTSESEACRGAGGVTWIDFEEFYKIKMYDAVYIKNSHMQYKCHVFSLGTYMCI